MTYILSDLPDGTATPKDYTRLHFDPAALPPKRIVGLLACQRDPLLRSLRTTVVAVRPAKALPVSKGREKQKKQSAPATPVAGALWEVEVLDTVIFPEGGGQPSDTGVLRVERPNGQEEYRIESCIRRKLESVHYVRTPEGVSIDEIINREVVLEVDWERRMDQMAIHTGQHLLSAILDTYELPTLAWGMAPFPSLEAPYVDLPRALTWAEAAEVERRCNEAIQADKKIWIDVTIQSQEGVDAVEEARENRGIPKDYEGGVIRHVCIDGIDRNACCGTQCPSLALVTALHVVPPSTPSTAAAPVSKAQTRLFFVAGPRAVRYLQDASRTLSLAAQAIAINRGDLVGRLAQYEVSRVEAMEREKGLRTELAQMVAEAAVASAADKSVLLVERAEKSTHDYEFLGWIGNAVGQEHASKAVVCISTAASPALLLVQSKDADLAKAVNDKVKEALENGQKGKVKGGGAKGRFMSKVEWAKGDDLKLRQVIDEWKA